MKQSDTLLGNIQYNILFVELFILKFHIMNQACIHFEEPEHKQEAHALHVICIRWCLDGLNYLNIQTSLV